MKWLILCFINFFVISNCIEDSVFEFGGSEGQQVWNSEGSIGPTVENRRTVVHYTLPPCSKMSHIKVVIHNPRWRPSVSVDAVKQQVAIFYRYNHNSESTYTISVSAVTDTNCTSTSNVVDNSNGESNDSKPDGEYADDEEIHEEEKTTKTQEYTVMNEAQDKKGTRDSIKAQDKNDAQDTDEATDKNDAQNHNDALDTIDAQEVNEAQNAEDNKQESGHTDSLRAARVMRSLGASRYSRFKPKHCEYCCPGKGCPKVFYALPHPHDFNPVDDESIFTRRKTKGSYSRLLLKK